jgi:hypothetical protein
MMADKQKYDRFVEDFRNLIVTRPHQPEAGDKSPRQADDKS